MTLTAEQDSYDLIFSIFYTQTSWWIRHEPRPAALPPRQPLQPLNIPATLSSKDVIKAPAENSEGCSVNLGINRCPWSYWQTDLFLPQFPYCALGTELIASDLLDVSTDLPARWLSFYIILEISKPWVPLVLNLGLGHRTSIIHLDCLSQWPFFWTR